MEGKGKADVRDFEASLIYINLYNEFQDSQGFIVRPFFWGGRGGETTTCSAHQPIYTEPSPGKRKGMFRKRKKKNFKRIEKIKAK